MRHSDYSQRLYEARDLPALCDLLQEVNERVASDAEFRPRNIRMAILRSLRDVTSNNLTVAREIIFEELWPRCVKGIEERGGPSSTLVAQEDGTQAWTPARWQEDVWEAHEARELLGGWLALWVEAEEVELRAEVVFRTCVEAHQPEASVAALQATCWTLSAIGWRSQEAESLLWQMIKRRDVAGDVAGGVLVDLGIEPPLREQFITQLKVRAKERPIRYNGYPMLRLRAPELAEDAMELFHARSPLQWFDGRRRTDQDQDNDRHEMDLKLSFLSHFADSVWYDARVQQQIWKTIFEACRSTEVGRHTLMFTGNLAPWCNSPEMVPNFLTVLPKVLRDEEKKRAGQKQKHPDIDPTHFSVYLAAERLEEAVRPQQIEGWQGVNSNEINAFKRIALQNTHQTGYQTTSPMRAKESAWRFLAIAGKRWDSEDVQQALSEESSGFVQGHIAEIIACFGCEPLPDIIHQVLTMSGQEADSPRELEVGEDSSVFFACRGMENIARATANREAFEALLSFNYLYGGEVLRSTSDSLSEVAIYLAREKKDETIIPRLWEVLEKRQSNHQYIAAISALHALSGAQQLPPVDWKKFLPVTHDANLDDYFRALAVQAIGFMEDESVAVEAGPALESLWLEFRTGQRIELSSQAKEALARHGTWQGEHSNLFLSDIGLEDRNGEWRIKQGDVIQSGNMSALFFLYKSDAIRFQTAVCDVLRSSYDEAAYALTFWLTRLDDSGNIRIEETVAQVMVEVLKATSERGVRRYLLDALSLGAPEILLHEQWSEVSSKWSTGARVALADAIGEADSLYLSEVTIQTLDLLAHDNAFVVRRAALRAIKNLAPDELSRLCEVWSGQSGSRFERQIAAQGALWVDVLGNSALSLRLLSDPEPSVREAAKESLEANRERQWADRYLQHVEYASTQDSMSPEAFRYGAALEQVGDDSHLRCLRRANTENMSPQMRFWRRQIIEELEKNWREKTRKWDDLGEGAISETVEGCILEGEKKIEVMIWLWLHPAAGVRGVSSWGGRLRAKNEDETSWLSPGEGRLILNDGRSGDILLGNTNITLGVANERWASFSGQERLEYSASSEQ